MEMATKLKGSVQDQAGAQHCDFGSPSHWTAHDSKQLWCQRDILKKQNTKNASVKKYLV